MAGGDKFSFTSGERRIIDQNSHPDCRRINVHKLQRCAFFTISQRFADKNFFKAGQPDNVTRAGMFDLDLLQSGVSKERRHRRALAFAVTVNANDRIAHVHAPAYDSAERNSSEVIAVIKIGNEHLKKWVR